MAVASSKRVAEPVLIGPWFPLLVAIAGTWFMGGLLLDGWAHNHLDLSKEGFFTPYHAAFYTGYAALVSVILGQAWLNHRTYGGPLASAIPYGYRSSLLGLAVFAVGGALDMAWHLIFGIEQDVEALFSPTHLLLASGGALILSGPIRATVRIGTEPTWRSAGQVMLPLGFLATLVAFFFMWAFSLQASHGAAPEIAFPGLRGDALDALRDRQISTGIASVVIRSLCMTGFALWIVRRLRLPFGAIAFLTALPSTLVAATLAPSPLFIALNAGPAIVAGLCADAFSARYDLFGGDSRWPLRAFGFGFPFLFWAIYIPAALLATGGFWWSPHLVYGAPAIAGLCGLLFTLVTEPRAEPATAQDENEKRRREQE